MFSFNLSVIGLTIQLIVLRLVFGLKSFANGVYFIRRKQLQSNETRLNRKAF